MSNIEILEIGFLGLEGKRGEQKAGQRHRDKRPQRKGPASSEADFSRFNGQCIVPWPETRLVFLFQKIRRSTAQYQSRVCSKVQMTSASNSHFAYASDLDRFLQD